MRDRLVSGAGAIAHLANRFWDRATRLFGLLGVFARVIPGWAAITTLSIAGAVVFGYAGVEAVANPTPRDLSPDEVASASGLGSRTYARLSGELADSYVLTYDDRNDNGTQDPGEVGRSWFYFLRTSGSAHGVVVRSATPPERQFIVAATGALVADQAAVAQALAAMGDLGSVTVDPMYFIDTSTPGSGMSTTIVVDQPLPAAGSAVVMHGSISDAYAADWADTNGNGSLDPNEQLRVIVFAVYDPATQQGFLVAFDRPPAFEATLTGMLRDDPGVIRTATTNVKDFDIASLGFGLSDRFFLDEGKAPASAPGAFVAGVILLVVAGVIVLGRSGRYLVFRPDASPFLAGTATLLDTEATVPLHVTGVLGSERGPVATRETNGVLRRVVAQPTEPEPTSGSDSSVGAAPPERRLVVANARGDQGVTFGSGDHLAIRAGMAIPFRGPRPAIELVGPTGRLILSFDDAAARDRAAGYFKGEPGLTIGAVA